MSGSNRAALMALKTTMDSISRQAHEVQYLLDASHSKVAGALSTQASALLEFASLEAEIAHSLLPARAKIEAIALDLRGSHSSLSHSHQRLSSVTLAVIHTNEIIDKYLPRLR